MKIPRHWIKRMMIHTLNLFCGGHEELLMKVSELSTAVAALSEQLMKVQVEILDRIESLENALIDVELPEEAIAAFEALRGQVQAIDDIVPDAVVEPAE